MHGAVCLRLVFGISRLANPSQDSGFATLRTLSVGRSSQHASQRCCAASAYCSPDYSRAYKVSFRGIHLVAPKRRIGGSGTPATGVSPSTVKPARLIWLLDEVSRWLIPFFETVLFVAFAGLLHLLLQPLDGMRTPLGRLCLVFCGWVPRRLALAYGCCGLVGSRYEGLCLDWRVIHPSRSEKRQSKRQRHVCPRQCHGLGPALHWQEFFDPWMPSLPHPVGQARPRFLLTLLLLASLASRAEAMTAPESSWVNTSPDEMPEEPSPLLPTVTGTNDTQLPWLRVAVHDSTHVHELPVDDPAAFDADLEKWLGVFVHTPMYHTVAAAVRPSRSERAYGLIDAILDHVGGVPHELYPVVVPIMPQRFPGYASFVRMPRVIRQEDGAGSTSIIVDLTRVGGQYFAEVVPKLSRYEDIEARLFPLTEGGEARLRLFVGRRCTPWPPGETFVFHDGVVLTASWSDSVSMFRGSLEDLLEAEDTWAPISQMPSHPQVHGTLVQYKGDAFFLTPQRLEDKGLATAVAELLKLDLRDFTSCGFPFQDFDYKGFACDLLFCVFGLPWPGRDRLQAQRRDLFTLCDGRALGVTPSVLHTCHPVIHLPSLAANMLIHLPLAMRLNAV